MELEGGAEGARLAASGSGAAALPQTLMAQLPADVRAQLDRVLQAREEEMQARKQAHEQEMEDLRQQLAQAREQDLSGGGGILSRSPSLLRRRHRSDVLPRIDELLRTSLDQRFIGPAAAAAAVNSDENPHFVDAAHERSTKALAKKHVDYLKQKYDVGKITRYDLKRETIVTAECVMCCPFTCVAGDSRGNDHELTCGLMQRIAFYSSEEEEELHDEWQSCHSGQHPQLANLLLQNTVCRCAYFRGYPSREVISNLKDMPPHPVSRATLIWYGRLAQYLWNSIHYSRSLSLTHNEYHIPLLPCSVPQQASLHRADTGTGGGGERCKLLQLAAALLRDRVASCPAD